jgi:hypothetical protein
MGKKPVASLIGVRPPENASFITLDDNSSATASAVDIFHLARLDRRQRLPTAARLTDRLIKRNASILSSAFIECIPEFRSDDVFLRLKTGNTVGAIPLISPTTGKVDYGVIVKPRFPWDGIGAMLSQMGWRVAPTPLKLDTFKGSERSIPPWVLSSMLLLRISNLLKAIGRKFELVTRDLTAPRGQVRWTEYASRSLPTGQFLSVPCMFPDLRQDRHLLGTIRYCLERIIDGLQSQVEHGAFVRRLIDLAQQLLLVVADVPIFIPRPTQTEAWLRKPLKNEFYLDGLQALVWTVEKRGLAGASKLEGIPWVMEMESFFEAWIETLFHSIARTTAGTLKVGRLRQTTRPIAWDPPYLGSQKSLIPDIWLQWNSTTLVIDAKYKRHFDELQHRSWGSIEAEWKEQHRNDLLQVLAYANLAESRTIISCLVYPCTVATWNYLRDSDRLFHKAEITVGERNLHLWMTAAPMKAAVDEVVAPIIKQLMPVIRAND